MADVQLHFLCLFDEILKVLRTPHWIAVLQRSFIVVEVQKLLAILSTIMLLSAEPSQDHSEGLTASLESPGLGIATLQWWK